MDTILESSSLTKLFEEKTAEWHGKLPEKLEMGALANTFEDLAMMLHCCNFFLWGREGKVRDESTADDTVAKLKREIDVVNWWRNEIVGRIDELVASELNIVEQGDWSRMFLNSETVGQMVDRISILVLKLFFNKCISDREDLDTAIRDECSSRLYEIALQLKYLAVCYDRFVAHLRQGTGCMLPFKQYKVYQVKDLGR